jgi:hypothetical protein
MSELVAIGWTSSVPDLLGGVFSVCFVGPFDEFAVLERRAGTNERD